MAPNKWADSRTGIAFQVQLDEVTAANGWPTWLTVTPSLPASSRSIASAMAIAAPTSFIALAALGFCPLSAHEGFARKPAGATPLTRITAVGSRWSRDERPTLPDIRRPREAVRASPRVIAMSPEFSGRTHPLSGEIGGA